MGWLVSFATAAFVCVWTVGADVHTFTDVQQQRHSAVNFKTVYVNGPALVKVEVSSAPSLGSSSSEGHFAIVFCPSGCNASQVVSCGPLHKPVISEKAQNVSMLEFSSPGPVSSRQEVLSETGAYEVFLASCTEPVEALTITLSGPNLGAHESGWKMHYACIALLYAGLCLVWLRIRGELDATRAKLLSDVSLASFMLLGMACAGFVVHALPQKEGWMKMGFVWLLSVTIATLMTTLLKMTAVGFETADNLNFEIAWYFFAICHFIALSIHEMFDGSFVVTLWHTYTITSPNANCILFPLIGGYVVFGVSCCFSLLRSATSLGKAEMSFVSRVAAVVVIYTVLSMISAFCRAYDVPSADPATWKSHFVSDIVSQLTQAFGLVAALYVFQQGVPTYVTAKGGVDQLAHGQIEEEIPEDESDDDQTAERQSFISPGVYGVKC